MTAITKTAAPPVRRVRFKFGDPKPMNHFFVENDIAFSHLVAMLSAIFPPGEESFIRSVRNFSDQITDPDLKKRVAGFIGQESVHGQEHRRLNEKLVEMGYPLVGLFTFPKDSRRQRWLLKFESKFTPLGHLAWTACAEHYTATIAKRLLESEYLQSIPADPEIHNLLNWHAIEESEHKSVAFDVYRAMGGGEDLRIKVMQRMLAITYPAAFLVIMASIATDPHAWRPIKVTRQLIKLANGPLLRGLKRELAVYTVPGFHPSDIDTTELEAEWKEKLFGKGAPLEGKY